jgi:iron complex outermembrane recepter protein
LSVWSAAADGNFSVRFMKTIFTFLLAFFSSSILLAQTSVTGTVRDAETGEGLPGAVVVIDDGKQAGVCDVEGRYKVTLTNGEHWLRARFIGYASDSVLIKVDGKTVIRDFNLVSSVMMKEVKVIADVAIDRKTPVAFYTVNQIRIREEGGQRDITMILNSTPGAYATEQGGGSGDSRVSIRGVDQRNVSVMVDGIPVNDMENGQVYWSNWAGLSQVTRSMQVQRGLGASRLAIPSVGGTINILTWGIDQKRSFEFQTGFGNDGMRQLSVGYNSGPIGKGWGVTMAGSRRTGNGWVNQTWDDQWSYFLKIQKRFEKHLFTISVNGAPQSHSQRYDRMPVAVLSKGYAEKLGIDVDSVYSSNNGYTTPTQGERGLQYNPNWGFIQFGSSEGRLSQDINFFHKPLFNFTYLWTPNAKFSLSTVAYVSIGYGGGTNFNSSVTRDTTDGQLNLTSVYNSNSTSIDALYSTTEHKSSRALLASMNNHQWIGVLSTAKWSATDEWSFMFGLDARHYKGIHYRMVYDLIGGDYFIDSGDKNQPTGIGNERSAMKRKGDKAGYWNDSYVDWWGTFAQAEYSKDKWTAFITLTGSYTSYQRVDHFKKRDVVLEDGTVVPMTVGYNEIYFSNGTDNAVAQNNATLTYYGDTLVIDNPSGPNDTIVGASAYAWNSSYARTAQTEKKSFPGFTVKTGSNYNLNDHFNVFMNLGFMKLAPRFNSVFSNSNTVYPAEISLNSDWEPSFLSGNEAYSRWKEKWKRNQTVLSAEFGFGVRYSKIAANLNVYFTDWKNKPASGSPTVTIAGDPYTYDIVGLATRLFGCELDFTWKPFNHVEIEGILAVGDWKYHAAGTVWLYDANYQLADSVPYSAMGVHLGDAAQTQFGGSVRWEPFKGFWIKPRYTFFSRNYANFDPVVLTPVYNSNDVLIGDYRDHESWQLPAYGLLDFYAGYEIVENVSKEKNQIIKVSFNVTVTNLLDTPYITDAQNGPEFNAGSSTVYMGMGRRWTAGMRIAF